MTSSDIDESARVRPRAARRSDNAGANTIISRLAATNSRLNDVFDRLPLIEASFQIASQKIDALLAAAPDGGGGALPHGKSEINANVRRHRRH